MWTIFIIAGFLLNSWLVINAKPEEMIFLKIFAMIQLFCTTFIMLLAVR